MNDSINAIHVTHTGRSGARSKCSSCEKGPQRFSQKPKSRTIMFQFYNMLQHCCYLISRLFPFDSLASCVSQTFFPKQFTVGFSLRKKAGRDMPWPRPRSVSAMCPPSSAFCARRVSTLAAPPNLVRLPCVCVLCAYVRHVSALSAQVHHVPSPL